ncbi:unnamed protein product [Penicillium palitans]
MTGNPASSMSAQKRQALLAPAMRQQGPVSTSPRPTSCLRHPSHIPIRDTRPQLIPYASQLQPGERYPYPEFPSLGYDPFPLPPSGLEGYTATQLATLGNSFQGLQSASNPVDSTGPIHPEELVPPTHVHSKGILPGHHKSGKTQPSASLPSKEDRPRTPSSHVPTHDLTSDLADMDWDSEPRTDAELEPEPEPEPESESESESEKRSASRGTNQKRPRPQTPDPTPNKKVRSPPAEPAPGGMERDLH